MLRMTVLGSCGTYPGPGRACSGYLFEAWPAHTSEVDGVPAAMQEGANPRDAPCGGAAGQPAGAIPAPVPRETPVRTNQTERPTRVWVDAGSGSLANLLRHAPLDEIDALWVSHMHADHCSDLPLLYYALKYGHGRRAAPLPVFGPAGWVDHLGRMLTDDAGRDVRDTLDVRVLRDDVPTRVGTLDLTPVRTLHSVETYAVRATDGTSTIAYSADTGPCDALGRLADRADLFLCEAAWRERPSGVPPIHSTPAEAGVWAARAGARRLVLTHLRPDAEPAAWARDAAERYGAPVGVAREGDTHTFGPDGYHPPEANPPEAPLTETTSGEHNQ